MKIIFDFDHTLFSNKRTVLLMKYLFEKLGVGETLFKTTFQGSKKKEGSYNPKEQFRLILKEKPDIALSELEKAYDEALNKSHDFLYPDTIPFLEKNKDKFEFWLVTYGVKGYQEWKIKKSGIGEYFKEIIITRDVDKTSVLKKIVNKEEKAVFVEDNPNSLSEVKKILPQIIAIRINRGEGKYYSSPESSGIDFSIKDLKELENILLTVF